MIQWPKEWLQSLGREPQVGDWYAYCCPHDLHQVESMDELTAVAQDADEVGWGRGVWLTKDSALAALSAEPEKNC